MVFPFPLYSSSLFWEEGKFPTFPHTGSTSVRRCVRQEEGDGQRRWLCRVLQQCPQRPVSCPLLKVGTFLPELSYTWCEGRLFFSYPYISCDYPDASKAGTVIMEVQDKLVQNSLITWGTWKRINYNSESWVCVCVYVSVPMHAEMHCVFDITDQAKDVLKTHRLGQEVG